MIFPCLYNAPIIYYALMLNGGGTLSIEQHDHYTKQTYRNRCRIIGGNGVMDMVIPIIKKHGKKTLMKDVEIDNDAHWQQVHWKSINSAYASSPFFEYVADYYQTLYSKKQRFLIDFNCALLSTTMELLNIDLKYTLTDSYNDIGFRDDIRETIHPKRPFKSGVVSYNLPPYQQVFSDRHGFVSDLSILDLLFNEGQNAGMFMKNSISKKL